MPIRASADSVRPATPFIPTSKDDTSNGNELPLPERPREVGPIFDEAHASIPIEAWSSGYKIDNYTDQLNANASSTVPSEPSSFRDQYLMPMLTKNERQRLTMLWYYTRNIEQDQRLMQKLNDKISLVKEFMGWEFAIVGILSNNNYIRIATSGLPLAILPRRESTCSHTVNQQSGSVFWLEDMSKDWRFRESPHVATGGLRSYAGTQLRFRTSTGDDVALGSLCIASNTPNEAYSADRKEALVRFAAMFTDEIINGARQVRHRVRQHMTQLIAHITARSEEPNIERVVIDTVHSVYPDARVTIQASTTAMINIRGREPFSANSMKDGIWEDSSYLEHLIISKNHEDLVATQTVRAIVGKSAQLPVPKYLVVDSMDVQLIFDDIDSWFVERCALTLCNILQKRFLEEALRAKEMFLRGITHQLRTPIHGVLASTDLLAEELAARDALVSPASIDMEKYASSKDSAQSILSTINSSGKELLATVNGILKLNRWAGLTQEMQRLETYKLDDLEQDLCKDMSDLISISHQAQITIFFDNRLDPPTPINTDPELLRECLSALAQNAMAYTTQGYVNIIFSSKADGTAIFDIIDTGCGIREEDQERIFEACERASTNVRGGGLGLTLSSKIATNKLDGSVILVDSVPTVGSHFRASFSNLIDRSQISDQPLSVFRQLKHLPKDWYYLQCTSPQSSIITPLSNYLHARGMKRIDQYTEGTMVVVDYTEDAAALERTLSREDQTQVRICLVPAGKTTEHLTNIAKQHNIILCTSPFTTARMEDLLKRVDLVYEKMSKAKSTQAEPLPAIVPQISQPPSQPHKLPTRPSMTFSHSQQKKDPHRFSHSLPVALLVDDNAINLHILKVYCEKRRIPYTTAMDGNQAVEAFTSSKHEEPFNLVLMDLQMPACDGIQATERIREIEVKAAIIGSRKPAVIFMVTGQDSAQDRRRSQEAGCDAFYVKPVSIKTLDQAIKTYFGEFVGGGHASGAKNHAKAASALVPGNAAGGAAESADGSIKRGRSLKLDSRPDGRDDSLTREVRRASASCDPKSEAVLTSSPTSDVPSTSLGSVMNGSARD